MSRRPPALPQASGIEADPTAEARRNVLLVSSEMPGPVLSVPDGWCLSCFLMCCTDGILYVEARSLDLEFDPAIADKMPATWYWPSIGGRAEPLYLDYHCPVGSMQMRIGDPSGALLVPVQTEKIRVNVQRAMVGFSRASFESGERLQGRFKVRNHAR